MLTSYSFSIRGSDHIKYDLPCQDSNKILDISDSWKIAAVADGVGSCKYSEIASRIAVDTICELIKQQFPNSEVDDRTYKSIILAAMHGAANAITEYVLLNDPENDLEYQTTLAVAVFSKNKVFFGNAGDSGIIVLDEEGIYHVLSTRQNDSEGSVYSIPKFRKFEVGTKQIIPVAVMCMTDGVYDFVAPEKYSDYEFKVNVPFANIFTTFALNIDDTEIDKVTEENSKKIQEYLVSEKCASLTDDLSVAAIIVTDSYLEYENIPWEEPTIDNYKIKWNELSVYNSIDIRIAEMKDYIKEKNPEFSENEVDELLAKYTNELRDDQEVSEKNRGNSLVKKICNKLGLSESNGTD